MALGIFQLYPILLNMMGVVIDWAWLSIFSDRWWLVGGMLPWEAKWFCVLPQLCGVLVDIGGILFERVDSI